MVKVSHLNKCDFYINCELIEQVEETPDTIVTMSSGKKIVIAQSAEELEELIIAYKRKIFSDYIIKIQND